MFNCKVCGSNYSRKYSLKQHENALHKGLKFDCENCGKEFVSKKSLTKHINVIHEGRRLKLKCKKCDKEFSETGIYYHVKSVHEQIKAYSCALCDYQSVQQSEMTTHSIMYYAASRQDVSALWF